MGVPPRAGNDVKMTLHALDETAMTYARSELGRDPHVTIVELDPSVIDKPKTDCGSSTCQAAIDAACAWSALQGAEYYAVASASANFDSSYQCTQYKSDIFSKSGGDECVQGHTTNEHTSAVYSLSVYDVKTRQLVPSLSNQISVSALGPEDQSKPEALAQLAAKVPAKAKGLPDQIMIGGDGRVASAASDGYYALYRGGHYNGYVNVRSAGTPAENVHAMYCCLTPSAGDALVERGRRKFVDLALDGTIGMLTFDGERKLAGGLGIHVRHYALDGGLQFGFGTDYLASLASKSNVFLFTPEIGWGIRIAPGFVASANFGGGFARADQVIESMNDAVPSSITGHLIATARIQSFLTTWFYVTADAGYVYSGTFDSWDGSGAGAAKQMSIRSPIVRVYAGFDI